MARRKSTGTEAVTYPHYYLPSGHICELLAPTNKNTITKLESSTDDDSTHPYKIVIEFGPFRRQYRYENEGVMKGDLKVLKKFQPTN